MARINKNNDLSICKASPSMSSVISGVQSFAFNYFKSKFPDNYFKSNFINTSLNSNNFKKERSTNQMTPRLAMSTNFELGDTFMQELPLWHTTQYYVINDMKRNYNMILEDKENDIRIFSVPQRYKVTFNFNIKLQTQMAAWNVLSHINQNFENGGYNYVNGIRIPSEIPRVMIQNIAKKMNIDLNSKQGMQDIRDYLMSHGLGPIEGSISPSSGNTVFRFDYTTNILLNFPDLANYDKEISSLITKDTSVRYAMSAELWTPASYILQIKNDSEIIRGGDSLSEADVHKFTIAIEHNIIPRENELGMKYLLKRNYEPDLNTTVDKIGFEPVLTEEVLNSIKEVRNIKGDISRIIDLKVFSNNIELDDSQYYVNYDTMELITREPQPNANYTLVLYADLKKLNMINSFINNKNRQNIKTMDIF